MSAAVLRAGYDRAVLMSKAAALAEQQSLCSDTMRSSSDGRSRTHRSVCNFQWRSLSWPTYE